jgi:hypothetical protein
MPKIRRTRTGSEEMDDMIFPDGHLCPFCLTPIPMFDEILREGSDLGGFYFGISLQLCCSMDRIDMTRPHK